MDELFARHGIDAESPEAFVRLLRQLPPENRAELETELVVHVNYALDARMREEDVDIRKLTHKIDCFVKELQPYRQYLDVAIERQKVITKGKNAVVVAVAVSMALGIIGVAITIIGNAFTYLIREVAEVSPTVKEFVEIFSKAR